MRGSGGARDGARAPSNLSAHHLMGLRRARLGNFQKKYLKHEILLLKIHYCVASNFDNHHCSIKFRIITILIISNFKVIIQYCFVQFYNYTFSPTKNSSGPVQPHQSRRASAATDEGMEMLIRIFNVNPRV